MKNIFWIYIIICCSYITTHAQADLLIDKTWKIESHYVSIPEKTKSIFHIDSAYNKLDFAFMRTSFNADNTFNSYGPNGDIIEGTWSFDANTQRFISNTDTFTVVSITTDTFCVRIHDINFVDNVGTIDSVFYFTKFIWDQSWPYACPVSGITFTRQTEIDSFPILYPDCDYIDGDLTINTNEGAINNLNALSQLTGIGGNLLILNTQLNNLSGLDNITNIGGTLWINENEQLSSLDGLNNLNAIDQMLRIDQNDGLTSLSGLNNLNNIGSHLRLSNNTTLNSLNGLNSIASIGGELSIQNHPALGNVSALAAVTSINGSLYIENNGGITNLEGLEHIDPDGIHHLVIKNCKQLAFCQSQNICSYLEAGGSYDIQGNTSGCENFNQLTTACDQRCPEDITLYTQTDVDNFYLIHAGCTEITGQLMIRDDWSDIITNLDGLQQITTVGGRLYLYRNNFLSDLSGLSNINYVGGDLYFNWHPYTNNLSGFQNIDSIGGGLYIDRNAAIDNLSGFTNLQKIGEDLYISSMDDLTNLSGLPPGLEVGGDLRIMNNDSLTDLSHIEFLVDFKGILLRNNDALTSLTTLPPISNLSGGLRIYDSELTDLSGLETLTSIDGDLVIHGNYDLENLNALENLRSINGTLNISHSEFLTNLDGLRNIDPTSISDLIVQYNQGLSTCEIEPICNYLENAGTHSIANNKTDCNSFEEITERCGIACSAGDLIFSTQIEIDDFSIDYPDCDKIIGNLTIMESSPGIITNLAGLGQIESIIGNVEITNNTNLPNLSGLDQLNKVVGDFSLSNNNTLTDVFGLDQLTSILGSFKIHNNAELNDLSMLESLEKIGGCLEISQNGALESLSGLGNINYVSIDSLILVASSSLSYCGVASICNYLDAGKPATISGNATGCNTIEETTASCNGFCLLEGITFTTQQELDDFGINYPDCSEIFGDVIIQGATNTSITNLSPLSNITKIRGDFINHGNDEITDFTALQNLTFVGGKFQISYHTALTSLTGLENLTLVGEDFLLRDNFSLENLNGLSNLVSIGDDFSIISNSSLEDLKGLENLLTIGETLTIRGNTNLSSLNGLQNLEIGSPQSLTIGSNNNLSNCEIESICNYLGSNFSTNRLYNKKGCDNYLEVQNQCGKACLYDGIVFTSQAEIDAFPINNLTCEKIFGNVVIEETLVGNITDLLGLSQLTSITGALTISNNQLLTNLSGLDQLTSISAGVIIENNTALSDLTALTNLRTIDGNLQIINNDALTSLTGLEYVEYRVIDTLVLVGSENLSICDVFPICNYIQTGGVATISGNAIGCMDIAEVSTACNDQCMIDGITFSTQTEIDNFVANHAGCTMIAGDVLIADAGSGDITNLNGLNSLTKIYGDLTILGNNNLTSLAPLENLNYVRLELDIRGNEKLINLNGLENLKEIGKLTISNNHSLIEVVNFINLEMVHGDIGITFNDSLVIIGGMENLNAIDGYLDITSNDQLTELSGFNQLTTIGGRLYIGSNEELAIFAGFENLNSIRESLQIVVSESLSQILALQNLTTVGSYVNINSIGLLDDLNFLQNITSIGGSLIVTNNDALTDFNFVNLEILGGSMLIKNNSLLENIEIGNLTKIANNLTFQRNSSLANLEGFENISTIGGSFIINDNPDLITLNGINNLDSIGGSLKLDIAYSLTDISALENLSYVGNEVYFKNLGATSLNPLSNLITIGGNLELRNCIGLNDLSGLEGITSIGGDLNIHYNNALLSLTGLENLNNVEGTLLIKYNHNLIDLSGVQNLNSIGGALDINFNADLENLNALENLTSINGLLSISSNRLLASIDGLRNIDATGITGLKIIGNNTLSTCGIESICNYLQGTAPSNIWGNLTNCNSALEVEESCNTVLPVELLSFQAKKEESFIRLNWQTASEENNLGFEIQKSDNGTDWMILDWVAGQGNSNVLNEYGYLDKSPYLGDNYYRLKQIDSDGRYTFSNIVVLRNNENDSDIKVIPNPSDGGFEVVILNPEKEKMKITLYDNTGHVLWDSGLVKDLDIWRKDFDLKKQSIYFLSAQIGSKNLSEKIVVIDE